MSGQNDSPRTDPQFDALLGRVLGRRRLSDEQRARHYARLGIEPGERVDPAARRATASSMTALPFHIGRSQSVTFGEPEPNTHRRPRQWLELGAAALAIVFVGALLTGLFDSGNGTEQETVGRLVIAPQTVIASPEATVLPTPPALATQQRLYAVGLVYPVQIGATVGTIGRLTAYDAETGRMLYVIDRGSGIDAILSPDGTRLYLAALNPATGLDELSAIDAAGGRVLWTIPLENRVMYDGGDAPSTLAVSPDGQAIYIYSTDGPGYGFIRVIDTFNGRRVAKVSGLSGCPGQLHVSNNGAWLYVVCFQRTSVQVINLESRQPASIIHGVAGLKIGSALSPDGRELYIVSANDGMLQLTTITANERDVRSTRQIAHIGGDELQSLHLVSLSTDGALLFVGLGSENPDGRPYADEVWVWDLDADRDPWQLPVSPTINGPSLAPAPDGRSVFAISNLFYERTNEPGRGDILKIGLDDSVDWFVRKNSEKIVRLLTGEVEMRMR